MRAPPAPSPLMPSPRKGHSISSAYLSAGKDQEDAGESCSHPSFHTSSKFLSLNPLSSKKDRRRQQQSPSTPYRLHLPLQPHRRPTTSHPGSPPLLHAQTGPTSLFRIVRLSLLRNQRRCPPYGVQPGTLSLGKERVLHYLARSRHAVPPLEERAGVH